MCCVAQNTCCVTCFVTLVICKHFSMNFYANVGLFYHSGKPTISPASNKRVGSLVRPTTPKSSVPAVSTFESIEDSDEDVDLEPDSKNDDPVYAGTNGAIVSARCICFDKQCLLLIIVDKLFLNDNMFCLLGSSLIYCYQVNGNMSLPSTNTTFRGLLPCVWVLVRVICIN